MKVSRLFAGVLIVLLGIALFLSNFDVLRLDWHFIFKLWPVLLVLAGISVLVSNTKWKTALYVVTLALVIAWVVSAASVGWGNISSFFHEDKHVHSQEFAQEMSHGIKTATLSIKSGAGSFTLQDSTSDLFRADAESNIGRYTFDSDQEGTSQSLDLNFTGEEKGWNLGKSTNSVDLRLNPKPTWDLDLEVGASSVHFNLVPYVVRRVTIKAGASGIKLRLGSRADTTDLRLETGVSSLVVYVPSGSGCSIRDNVELSHKSFDGFVKEDNGYYETPNFNSAKKRILIHADAGVSSIKVERY